VKRKISAWKSFGRQFLLLGALVAGLLILSLLYVGLGHDPMKFLGVLTFLLLAIFSYMVLTKRGRKKEALKKDPVVRKTA